MKANYQPFVHSESVARIDEILDGSDNQYEEVDAIPSRDRLTFTNGFYANCSALFIDLRASSELPKKHKRPRLAKIYRTFISECVAVINGNSDCAEVNIHGDAIWGVFDTPLKRDVDATFSTAASLNSIVQTLNCRYRERGIDGVRAGIGVSWGRALMIKTGHKGSTINEVVWMGDVVNDAANLCNKAAKYPNKTVMVSAAFYENLNDSHKGLLEYNYATSCYHGEVINQAMDAWIQEHCT